MSLFPKTVIALEIACQSDVCFECYMHDNSKRHCNAFNKRLRVKTHRINKYLRYNESLRCAACKKATIGNTNTVNV